IRETGDFSLPAAIPVVSIATFALLCYAGVMLWLGRRTLARFQVTGGMAGDDLLMAVPGVMPEALAGLFRCRPTGPFLNLIRKELRLLRPLWLLTLLFLLYWTCLTMLRPSAVRESFGLVAIALATPALGLGGLIAMLAGCLSLGEERTSGTHSWHMTLPVPARRQWLIKLLMAVFTGFVCTLLLPLLVMAASEFIHGSPVIFFDILSEHHRLDSSSLHRLLIIVPLLSFVSFWCACAVNGMLRAALWVFPAMGAVLLAGVCGDWVGRELAQATVTPMDLVVSWFHFNPWYAIPDGPKVTWLVVPALLFGVIQSYRLFRTQREDSTLSVIRCLLPLALVAFLCSFSVSASGFGDYPRSRWLPFSEAGEAIEKLQLGVTKLDAAHPLQLTVEDLAKSSPMSALTRRWLRGSNIIVAPNQAHSGYFATIHLASGLDCRLAVGHYGGRPVFAWRPCVPRSP
ncbi:MAG TPA: hypothetical protein VGR03_10870, partial [Candidatus Acidoferrum sp.]|nr:hypothetical protein [Candidatus Acidoferrum sp.]